MKQGPYETKQDAAQRASQFSPVTHRVDGPWQDDQGRWWINTHYWGCD